MDFCSSVPATSLTHAEVECLLSSGSEGKESAVKAYIDEKLKNLSRSGLEQTADVSDGAMSRILVEQEAPPTVTAQPHLRKIPFPIVDVSAAGPSEVGNLRTSTPVTSALSIYKQRKSSLLKFPAESDVDDRKRRVEFEIGDDVTSPANRSLTADVTKGNVVVLSKLGVLV